MVLVVAGGGDVEGGVTQIAPGQHAVALIGDGVEAEVVEVLLAIEQGVHHAGNAFGGDHDRPGKLLSFAAGLAPQQALHQVAHHLVVAVEPVEGAGEGVREAEAADEIAHGDLTVAQLRFQEAVAVALKSVEKDLAIRRLNHCFEVLGVHRLVEGYDLEVFVRAHANPLHPGVLGDGRVRQEGNSHSVVSIRRR